MSEVFVVTTGSYSDYSIRGIFSTRALAEQYMQKCRGSEECYNKDFNNIEVHELDQVLKEKEYTRWSVGLMLDNGSIESFEYRQNTAPYEQRFWGIPTSGYTIAENIPAHNGRGAVRAESHKSAAHCMKVAVEGRQKWLRERRAPTEGTPELK